VPTKELERPVDTDLDELPVLDQDDTCHILKNGLPSRETMCGAPYDCIDPTVCSAYNGQECCPDCGRAICLECEQIMRDRGDIGGIRSGSG
jgi:hypothetical protein